MNKSIFESKTFWLQIVAVLTALLPPVAEWLAANPVEFVAVLAAANVLVRFATSGKVSVFGDDTGSNGGGASMLLALAAVGIFCGAVPSCGVPLSVGYETPEGRVSYSSKGGLSVDWRAAK